MKKFKHIGIMMISALALVFGVSTSVNNAYDSECFHSVNTMREKIKNAYENNQTLTNENAWDNINKNKNDTINTKIGEEGYFTKVEEWYECKVNKNNELDDEAQTYAFTTRERAEDIRKEERINKALKNKHENFPINQQTTVSVEYDGEVGKVNFWSVEHINRIITKKITNATIYVIQVYQGTSIKPFAFLEDEGEDPLKTIKEACENSAQIETKHYQLADGSKHKEYYDEIEKNNFKSDVVISKNISNFTITSYSANGIFHEIVVTTPSQNQVWVTENDSKSFYEKGIYYIHEWAFSSTKIEAENTWKCFLTSNKIEFQIVNDYEDGLIQNKFESEDETIYFRIPNKDNPPKLVFTNFAFESTGQIKYTYQEKPSDELIPLYTTGEEGISFDTGIYEINFQDKVGNKFYKKCYVSNEKTVISPKVEYNYSGDNSWLTFNVEFPKFKDKKTTISNFSFTYFQYYCIVDETSLDIPQDNAIVSKDFNEALEELNKAQSEGKEIVSGDGRYIKDATYQNHGTYIVLAVDKNGDNFSFAFDFNYALPDVKEIKIINKEELQKIKLGEVIPIQFEVIGIDSHSSPYIENDYIKFTSSNENVVKVDRIVTTDEESEKTTYSYNLLGVGVGNAQLTFNLTNDKGTIIHTERYDETEIFEVKQPIAQEINLNSPYVNGNKISIPKTHISDFNHLDDKGENIYPYYPSLLGFNLNGNLGLTDTNFYDESNSPITFNNFSNELLTYRDGLYKTDYYNAYHTWCGVDSDFSIEESSDKLAITKEGKMYLTQFDFVNNERFNISFENAKSSKTPISKNFELTIDYDDIIPNKKEEINSYSWKYIDNYEQEYSKEKIKNQTFFPGSTITIQNVTNDSQDYNFSTDVKFANLENSSIFSVEENGTKIITNPKNTGVAKVFVVLKRNNTGNRGHWSKDEKGEYKWVIDTTKTSEEIILDSFEITNSSLTTEGENSEIFKTVGYRKESDTTVSTFDISKKDKVSFSNDKIEWKFLQGDEVLSLNSNDNTITSNGIEGTGIYEAKITEFGQEQPTIKVEINTFKEVERANINKINKGESVSSDGNKIVTTGGFIFETTDENFHLYINGEIQNNGYTYKTKLKKEGEYENFNIEAYKLIVQNEEGIEEVDYSLTRIKANSGNLTSDINMIEVKTAKAQVKQNNWWIGLIIALVSGAVVIVVVIFLVRKVKKKYKVQNL